MPLLTFSQLREGIDQRMDDPAITQGKTHCFYKIFQHALTYSLTESHQKLLKNRLHWPVFAQRAIYRLKSFNHSVSPSKMKSILLMDDGRIGTDENGTVKSYYFGPLLDELGRDGISIARDHNHDSALPREYELSDIELFRRTPIDPTEGKMLEDISFVLSKAKKSGKFNDVEIDHISSALHSFFEQYHMFYQWLKNSGVKHLLMTNHYHREGIIAAAKDLGIISFEFQHGLIAAQDLYYVYDNKLAPFADKAFFCDHLVVFGDYWKNVLLKGAGYAPEQLIVAGDYSIQRKAWKKHLSVEKENAIFIGAQKNMPEHYIRYTKQLLSIIEEKHPEWEVWVKLHPYEKEPKMYNELLRSKYCKIYGNGDDLMALLSKSKIQISVYSTTFFDALGLGVVNFSLQNYTTGSDYAKAMAEEGMAVPLLFDEDPVEKFELHQQENLLNREDVYGPIDLSKLKALLDLN